MIENKKRLLNYAALSSAFLFLRSETDAQVVYVDIDPDIVLNTSWEGISIDINANGYNDVVFEKFSGTYTTTDSIAVHRDQIFAIPEGAVIAGSGDTGTTTINLNYAYAIANNAEIGTLLPFPYLSSLRLARHSINSLGGVNAGGFWYPEVTNHFIGVKLIDDSACIHYGWIRCSVLDTARVLIIKDYGYEIKCNTPIIAGDKIGDTTTAIPEVNSFDASIYSFGQIIYFHLPEIEHSYDIHIYNSMGEKIYFNPDDERNFSLELNQPKGVYIIEVVFNSRTISKKVIIN